MAARIVYFGEGTSGHVETLTEGGFEVTVCGTSFNTLHQALCQQVDAVAIEEEAVPSDLDIVSVVRTHNWIPLILFEGETRKFDSLQFETAIPLRTPAHDWLGEISRLIETSRCLVAECRSIKAQSATLRSQSCSSRQKSQEVRSRSRRLISR